MYNYQNLNAYADAGEATGEYYANKYGGDLMNLGVYEKMLAKARKGESVQNLLTEADYAKMSD